MLKDIDGIAEHRQIFIKIWNTPLLVAATFDGDVQ
jgi:hypothetical protein